MDKNEDLLADRLKDGDRNAAAELVDEYYEQLYLFMRRLGHSRQVSEDLVQESFLTAWRHIGQLRKTVSLKSWLYRIAINVSKMYWRRNKAEKSVCIENVDLRTNSDLDNKKSRDYEQIERLRTAVARLPVKWRQAIVLHYMQGLTIAQAAEAAHVSEGTLKSRLNRALKALRTRMDAER